MSGLLKVSSNPHIRSKVTTSSIMTAVVIALLPAAGFGIYNFGPRALAVMAVKDAAKAAAKPQTAEDDLETIDLDKEDK